MAITFNASTLLNGNGIDVNSIVSQIQAQESGQLTVWQQEQDQLQTQAGDLTSINSDLQSLASAAQALADPVGAFSAMSATSSEPGILTATAQPSAVAGNHTVVVSTLASPGAVYTDPVASANASILPSGASGGDLQLQIGGDGGNIYDVPLTPGSDDTVSTLANFINQRSAAKNWGITATVLNDATGVRLAIYTQATGTPLAISSNSVTGVLSTADVASADASVLADDQQTGDIQMQIGGATGSKIDLPITAGVNDSLNSLASYINTQSAQNNWSVSASVVQDANGYHLTIASQASGPAGALSLTANSTNLTVAPNPSTNLKFEPPVGGGNATFTVDGIPFSSTSNTVTGAIPGVTLNLISAYQDMPVTLSVGSDDSQITGAVNTFVSAYNKVITDLNQQFAVNASTGLQGPLGSDSALSTLQSTLLSDITYSITGNDGLVNLAALGINMNDDGTLTVNASQLNNALNTNPAAVQSFFQGSSLNGFANNLNSNLTQLNNPVTGLLNVDLSQNHAEQTAVTNDINAFQQKLAMQKVQLLQEYSDLNASLEAYPYLLRAITAELGALDSNGNSSSSSSPNSGTTNSSTSGS